MGFDGSKFATFLRGVATLAEDPEKLDEFVGKLIDATKNTGKAAALEAIEKSTHPESVKAMLRAEVQKRWPT